MDWKFLKVREDSKVLKSVWGFILLTTANKFDWSVNQIVLFNGFLADFVEITSCVYSLYILKQLFFSISVNSGFRNIYLATSWLGKYLAIIQLDFKE